jgi:hypothetical protein
MFRFRQLRHMAKHMFIFLYLFLFLYNLEQVIGVKT